MKYLIAIAVILVALIQVGISSETMEKVKPGDKTIDLGDGYQVSFVLDDAFEAYDIEVSKVSPVEFNGKLLHSGSSVYIYPNGKSDEVFLLQLTISPESQRMSILDANTETYDGITTVITPMTIDKSPGSTLYKYLGDSVKSPEEAITAAFRYNPGSTKVSDDTIESRFTVQGESAFKESGLSEEYPVFEAILDSIHLTGPEI